MTVYAYVRLDAVDNMSQKKAMLSMIADYLSQKGLGELKTENTHTEACSALTPIPDRDLASIMVRHLKSGDVLVVPHFGSLFGAPTSAEAFLRRMNGLSVRVHVVELGRDVTELLHLLSPLLKTYGAWESELIQVQRAREGDEAQNEEMLQEFGRLAMQHLGERIAAADLGSAIKEALHEAQDMTTEKRAARAQRSRRASLAIIDKSKLRNRPDILARISGDASGE